MRKFLFPVVIAILVAACYFFRSDSAKTIDFPAPQDGTKVRIGQEEDEGNANRREQYFELMHRAAPDVDWRAIDQKTHKKQYREKLAQRKSGNRAAFESFANGDLEGEWFERGSNDQSGSITAVDYDLANDDIYAMSDAGTLWKGDRFGNNWSPLNEDLQFHSGTIKVTQNPSGGKRLLTSIGKIIHYSDDEGITWTAATGFNFYDSSGGPRSVYVLNDANKTIYYLVETWNGTTWSPNIWLFRSTDGGQTFAQIHTFAHGDNNQISMWSPFNSSQLYILDKSSTLYQVSGTNVNVLNSNTVLPTGVNCQLRGSQQGNSLTLYALTNNTDLYKSTNNGLTWTPQGSTPTNAWNVGIEVSLDDPNKIYYGEVNSYRTANGGANWTLVNQWWEYYNDVANKLHADIMDFQSFYDPSGNEFTLIANHGGLSISYDNMVTNTNIALQGLNVSQYYDVVTSENDPSFMYAGTQDQGFQRSGQAVSTNLANWEQETSGDYGHMIFSQAPSGESLWTQYPGGDMSYYANPQTGGITSNWIMTGQDLPSVGWILPSCEVSNTSENAIYIGGGNINGGTGNYLVKLTYNSGNDQITATQGNFDFKANSNNGSISAIETSKLSLTRIYVATDNGYFFASNNNGASWTQTFVGPGGWYLYGATILASDITSDVVYFGGSGYSNPAVFKSSNGGLNFTDISAGLPNTLVHELAANADESLLFAATEVGPYVYSVAQNQWFEMRGTGAPMQRYTSVEYIDSQDVVRFGTFGRGTWDFNASSCAAVLNVNGSVNSGTYQAGMKVVSDGQISGGNVIYSGGECVELEAGFEVQTGAEFSGEIGGCN